MQLRQHRYEFYSPSNQQSPRRQPHFYWGVAINLDFSLLLGEYLPTYVPNMNDFSSLTNRLVVRDFSPRQGTNHFFQLIDFFKLQEHEAEHNLWEDEAFKIPGLSLVIGVGNGPCGY